MQKKLIQQCGVLVRDYVPITFREWKPIKGTPDCYVVGPAAKKALWIRLMKNFVLPPPEVASDEEVEPNEAELKRRSDRIEAKVRHFAEKKMAQAFCSWKKKLNTKFIKTEETPDWPQKARCHGRLGFRRTRRDIPIEAIRGERRRRLMRRSKLKRRNAVLQAIFGL